MKAFIGPFPSPHSLNCDLALPKAPSTGLTVLLLGGKQCPALLEDECPVKEQWIISLCAGKKITPDNQP